MEPRWLDDDEQAAWRALLSLIARLDADLDRQLRRDAGMPHGYYLVLVMLAEQPERRARMSLLAERTHSSQSRLSHAVARLEERGWVSRTQDAGDRRGTVATLTEAGWAALVAAAPGHVDQVRRTIFDQLSGEQVATLRAIGQAVTSAPEQP
jgi:DNA-binding MarR family transcriptional regulator